ncbi:DUF5522 domain-containing protein [Dermatobacter hominis]|uniref:DUF5522 domain-containing protein n=1 Tax=Dermatobacter hominis TaxID=2884263 RepID=UPI001D106F96|nr:DUF5522 domain-containing protein [Dermatobacter hominis]UDY37564.1 DUF5522 domain-containing protein [Dermatobacter hominis]
MPAEETVDDGPTPAIAAAHREAMRSGAPMYLDPETGLFVMTAAALAERGHCCGSGCRHCPYPADERRRAGRPGS